MDIIIQRVLKNTALPQNAPTRDFRLYLQEVLVARCRANPAYSLRAFARQLQMEPSFLSKILSGKRSVTPAILARLAARLELDPARVAAFASAPASPAAAEAAYRDLTADQFAVIADWYHYAILELAKTRGFSAEPAAIARRLGIRAVEARAALERLQRLEMIGLDARGRVTVPPASHTTVSSPFTTAAFRKLQRQILEQAIDAMEEVPIELRDQSSMTMAIDPRLLPEAREMIRKFRRDLCALLQRNGPPHEEVYQLSVSLFPARQNLKGVRK